MKKFAFTTAIALALATTAYAADHGGRGGGPGGGGPGGGPGGMSTMSPGGGGPGGHPGSFSNSMGPNQGMSGLHNQSPMTNTYKNNGGNYGRFREGNQTYKNNGGNNGRFTEGNRHMYNYGGNNFENREGRHFEGGRDHHGVVSGNFFEHGRHFHFRRFFNGEWVFLNAWDDCTAYAWVNVAPGTWAWAPVNVCVG